MHNYVNKTKLLSHDQIDWYHISPLVNELIYEPRDSDTL